MYGEGYFYQFPDFNGATVDVCEFLSYFLPHINWLVITHPVKDKNKLMLVKVEPDINRVIWRD